MVTVQEAFLFTGELLMTKVSQENIHVQDYSRWPTAAETPTQVNFLSLLNHVLILMINTLFLVRLLMEWKLSSKLRKSPLIKMINPEFLCSLLIVAKSGILKVSSNMTHLKNQLFKELELNESKLSKINT